MGAMDELGDDWLWWVTIDDGLRWLPVIACWWTGQDDQVGLDPGHFSSARILPGVIVIAGSWFQTSPPKKNMTRLRSSSMVGWLGWRVLSTTRARLSTRSSFKKCHSPSSQFIQPHPRPGSRCGSWGTLGAPWGTLGHPDQYAQRAAAADQGWEANVQTNTRCLDLMEFYHGHGDKLLISIGLKTDHLEKGCRNRINFWNRVSQNQLGPWFLSLGLLETCFFFEFWNNWVCLKNEGCRFTP